MNHRFQFAVFASVWLIFCLIACDKSPAKPTSKPKTTATHPSSRPLEIDTSFRFKAPGRIVAIGDLHGDMEATRRVLKTSGLMDEKGAWTGEKTVLVQTGDMLDRGDGEREIMDLLDRLTSEAQKAGGAVHVLLGNHEVMNVQGDFRYVTRGGFGSFENVSAKTKVDLSKFPEHMRHRAAAFLPGGPFALRLAKFNTVVMVNDTLFVHGGLLPSHVKYGVGKINREVKAWMRGERKSLPKMMRSEKAPTWSRRFSDGEVSARDCRVLNSVLNKIGAKQMVVGHTVQKGGISSACNKRVWRIDVGLASHYGAKVSQALAIDGDKVRVLRADADTQSQAF